VLVMVALARKAGEKILGRVRRLGTDAGNAEAHHHRARFGHRKMGFDKMRSRITIGLKSGNPIKGRADDATAATRKIR
jgi:hypothetical protein